MFFFFEQKTAYEMRISDWSSDVCSSDLRQIGSAHLAPRCPQPLERLRARHFVDEVAVDIDQAGSIIAPFDDVRVPNLLVESLRSAGHAQRINRNVRQIGRESCRERVCQYV